MPALRFILADQLSHSLSALEDIAQSTDTILMCEVMDEASYVPHHPKKIAFLFSAMRHFAKELEEKGCTVRYITLDDKDNTKSLKTEILRALKNANYDRVIMTHPGEYRVLKMMHELKDTCNIPVEIRTDTRFLSSIADFKAWAGDKKQLRMEFFYRDMRKKHHILIDEKNAPTGGKWNYDSENRKPPKEGMRSPARISHKKDSITKDVLALVKKHFGKNFGDLEPFHFAVTREQALKEAQHFFQELLANFGSYQDAMVKDEAYLYHSLVSSYLNAGLLDPKELCDMAQKAYENGTAPLNAAEGFIRQILGWREFIRGIYWREMPGYTEQNHLNAQHDLPDFYWGGKTKMACIEQAVTHTKQHAYSHHIQRLMVTGNFALIAGINPQHVHQWYLAVYADAYEWVEAPNTLGMALYADGGTFASKPYAASGKYIDKMSNYCKDCHYTPKHMTEENACPFNALYWDFIARNEEHFKSNQRMGFMYGTWKKFSDEKQSAIANKAKSHIKNMQEGSL